MQIVKVEAFPKRHMRSGGENYEPYDRVEVIGEEHIGMMSPRPEKYLVLKNYEAGKQQPSEVFIAEETEWRLGTNEEADKLITAARKRWTAQKRKDEEGQAKAQAAAKTATEVAKGAAAEQSGGNQDQQQQDQQQQGQQNPQGQQNQQQQGK